MSYSVGTNKSLEGMPERGRPLTTDNSSGKHLVSLSIHWIISDVKPTENGVFDWAVSCLAFLIVNLLFIRNSA